MKKWIIALICLSVAVLAAVALWGGRVSAEEYEAAIAQEFAKYGVETCVFLHDSNAKTRESTLDQALLHVRQCMQQLQEGGQHRKNDSPKSMHTPRTVDVSGVFYPIGRFSNSFGLCGIQVNATVTLEEEDGELRVTAVDCLEAGPVGSYANFVSWETGEIEASLNAPDSGWLTLTAVGTVSFAQKIPVVNLNIGYTGDVTGVVLINCAEF